MTDFAFNVKKWYMPEKVTGYYVRSEGLASESPTAVYIPVIMPKVTRGTQSETRRSLTTSCFCNDSRCKPSVSSSIGIRNYISVPHYQNQGFRATYVRYGAEFQIESINGNVDNLWMTNNIDQSYNKYYYN